MKSSWFWKAIAVGMTLGLFSIGYGLLYGGRQTLTSWSSTAYAGAENPAATRPAMLVFNEVMIAYRNNQGQFQRAKVPGGWLIILRPNATGVSVCFYPDPAHQWDGGSLK